MNDHELDELVAGAAVVHDDDLRSPTIHAAMRAATEEIIAMPQQTPAAPPRVASPAPTVTPHRRARALLAAAAVVALVGVAVAVTVDGGGDADGTGEVVAPSTGQTLVDELPIDDGPVEIDAQIVSATREAFADSVVQITQVNVDGYRDTMWSDEATGAFRIRMLSADGSRPLYDSGAPDVDSLGVHRSVDHCFAEYVEVTEQIGPSGDADEQVPVTPFPAQSEADRIVEWIETGMIVADGTELVDGVEMLLYRWVDEERTMLVDPVSYRPTTIHGYPGTEFEYVQTYEFFDRTPENLDLLSVEVPEGFTLVDQLRGDAERADAGCA